MEADKYLHLQHRQLHIHLIFSDCKHLNAIKPCYHKQELVIVVWLLEGKKKQTNVDITSLALIQSLHIFIIDLITNTAAEFPTSNWLPRVELIVTNSDTSTH